MKILLVSESYWPNLDGAAVFQYRLVKEMERRGHQMIVWTPGTKFHSYVEVDGTTKIYRERSVSMLHNPRYRFSFWPFAHARPIMQTEHPDLVHIQTPFQSGLAALIAAKKLKIPVLATNQIMPENLLTFPMPPKVFTHLSGLIWRYSIWFHNQATYVTAPSPTALSYLTVRNLLPSAEVISNGLDLGVELPKRTAKPVPHLLYLGRHDAEKNLITLLKAAEILHKNGTVFHLDMAGTGNQVPNLVEYIKKHGLETMVTLHGRVSELEKQKAFREADIFVIPSPAELQSIVTLEAMGAALPVVAANAGALPDLVKDGLNGFLVSSKSAADFAKACQILIESPELREQFGRAGYLQIQEQHASSKTFDAYEAAYRRLC